MRKIRKGDTVEVISGDEKGKRGSVQKVITGKRRDGSRDPNDVRVIVSGVNLVKKHQRRLPEMRGRTQYGIIDIEAPIHISNVALVCPKCDKPTRVGFRVFEDGTKSRFCKRCGELID